MDDLRDLVPCPERRCAGGRLHAACETCGGDGFVEEAGTERPCDVCRGEGELPGRTCGVCDGAGAVPFAVLRIFEGERWVAVNDPSWHGDDAAKPGRTMYSLASWWRRRRDLRPLVAAARGRPYERGVAGVVELVDGDGNVLIRFHGFAWGYGGTGPSGLGAVLADALPARFPSFEAAMAFVAGQPMEEPWQVGALPEAGP